MYLFSLACILSVSFAFGKLHFHITTRSTDFMSLVNKMASGHGRNRIRLTCDDSHVMYGRLSSRAVLVMTEVRSNDRNTDKRFSCE